MGEVREVIYDYLTGVPIWLGVGRTVTLVVPAWGVVEEGDHLRSDVTREAIEHQPPSDFGQGFANLGEERHLYEYFDVVMDQEPELRVLLEGDELPGLERNE